MRLVPRISRVKSKGGARFYEVEGYNTLFPSVTTILEVISKPALQYWEKSMALKSVQNSLLAEPTVEPSGDRATWVNTLIKRASGTAGREASAAASFGTQAHVIFDQLLKGRKPEIAPRFETVAESFTEWLDNCHLTFSDTEQLVFSAKHGYAGAIDAIGHLVDTENNKKLVCLDWKTSKATRSEYALQLAAYSKAVEEMMDISVDECWVVRLNKIGKPGSHTSKVVNIERSFDTFLSALHLWNQLNNSEEAWFQETHA